MVEGENAIDCEVIKDSDVIINGQKHRGLS